MLPRELLAMMLGFVPTRDLMSCLFACKTLKDVVLCDAVWERRCRDDLGWTSEHPKRDDTWIQTYRSHALLTGITFSFSSSGAQGRPSLITLFD